MKTENFVQVILTLLTDYFHLAFAAAAVRTLISSICNKYVETRPHNAGQLFLWGFEESLSERVLTVLMFYVSVPLE